MMLLSQFFFYEKTSHIGRITLLNIIVNMLLKYMIFLELTGKVTVSNNYESQTQYESILL